MILENFEFIKVDVVDKDFKILLSASDVTKEGNRLLLHGEDFPVLPLNTYVMAIGYNKKGITSLEGLITLSISDQINLEVQSHGTVNDRRDYLKVRTKEEAIIRIAFMGKSEIGLKYNETVRLRDISLGGVCFFSNNKFLHGQRLFIELHEIRQKFIVEAKILRPRKEGPGRSFRYRYGCKFINLDDIQQRILCEHVFKTELINYQKEVE